jgi:hypothetical protein
MKLNVSFLILWLETRRQQVFAVFAKAQEKDQFLQNVG